MVGSPDIVTAGDLITAHGDRQTAIAKNCFYSILHHNAL